MIFSYPETYAYTCINNSITRASGTSGTTPFYAERQIITALTANSMVWKSEFENDWDNKSGYKATYTKPDEAKPVKAVFMMKLVKVNNL